MIGTRLGPFTIQSLLGAGGMGEVYRARDSTLDRDVAIKILPEVWLADPDRRARFDREARLLASLNHPHIGAIYGVEDLGQTRALVLESRSMRPTLAINDSIPASADSPFCEQKRFLDPPTDRPTRSATEFNMTGIVHRRESPSALVGSVSGLADVQRSARPAGPS